MDAETSQALSDLVVSLQDAVTNGREVAAALADIAAALAKPQQDDDSKIIAALGEVRDALKNLKPAAPPEGFEIVTTHTYDKQDRVIETRSRAVRIRS